MLKCGKITQVPMKTLPEISPSRLLAPSGLSRAYTDGGVSPNNWEVEDEFERATEIAMVPIEMISLNPDNPRRDDLGADNLAQNGLSESAIKEFAHSLREARARGVGLHGTGIHTPLVVRRETARTDGRVRYVLVEGERRYRASVLNGLTALPCEIRDLNKRDAFLSALEIGLTRKDWSPLEEALALRAFMNETGLGIRKTADCFGRNRRQVEDRLNLLKLQGDCLELLTHQNASMTLATEVNKITDPVIRREAIALARNGVTQKQIQELVRQRQGAKPAKPAAVIQAENKAVKQLQAAFPAQTSSQAGEGVVAPVAAPHSPVLLSVNAGLCLSSAASQISRLNDAMGAYGEQSVPDGVRTQIEQGMACLATELETLRKWIDGSKLSE